MKSLYLLFPLMLSLKALAGAVIVEEKRNDVSDEEKKSQELQKKYNESLYKYSGFKKPTTYEEETRYLDGSKNYLNNLGKKSLKFTSCDEKMPEINLESPELYPGSKKKGSLSAIPHEHQDGYGTCYANTTRNLIIAASGGKINPSVFDIALSFKKAGREAKVIDGFDQGFDCYAFEAVKKIGYCDNSNSPLENGEAPPLIELMTKGKSTDEVLKSYYELEKSTATLGQKTEILGKVAQGVQSPLNRFLALDSKMALGEYKTVMSSVEKKLIDHFRGHSAEYGKILKKLPDGSASLPLITDSFPDIDVIKKAGPLDKSLEVDLRHQRAQFEWQARKMMDQKQSLADVMKLRDEYFAPIAGKLTTAAASFSDQALKKWWDDLVKDESFQKKNSNALKFYAELENQLDPELQASMSGCSDYQMDDFMALVSGFQRVVLTLEKEGVVSDAILSNDLGMLRDPSEILENLYMPACAQKRKPLPLTNSCIPITMKTVGDDKKKMDKVILSSLMENRAIGYDISGHAMTLTGMRFNKTTNSCEYLVRNSSTATSNWTKQDDFYGDMTALNVITGP